MLEYEKIVTRELCIDDDLLRAQDEIIRERLLAAVDDANKADHTAHFLKPEIYALNQCIYLASNVVLFGSNRTALESTINSTRKNPALADLDPTTVVTVTALYYLIRRAELSPKTSDAERKKLCKLLGGFDKINWFLTEDAMRFLGIKPAAKRT